MMDFSWHGIALALAIVLTAISQLLLRQGAVRGARWMAGFVNPRSVAGYSLFVLVAALNVFALQAIPLRTLTAWTSLTYVLTIGLSHWILKEKLNAGMLAGCGLIMAGIVVFSL